MTSTGRTAHIRAATTMALWAAALADGTSPDLALAVLREAGLTAGVRADDEGAAARAGLPGPGAVAAPLAELLPLLRTGGAPVLLLPVAGDLRGLPVGSRLTILGLDAGAVTVLPAAGLALVPDHGGVRVFSCGPVPAAEPERDLRMRLDAALHTATGALRRLDVARSSGDPHREVAAAMTAAQVDLPPGIPSRVADLLHSAATVEALLAVVNRHGTTAATTAQLAAVDDALAPLAEVAREARRTAVAVAVASLHPAAAEKPAARPAGVIR